MIAIKQIAKSTLNSFKLWNSLAKVYDLTTWECHKVTGVNTGVFISWDIIESMLYLFRITPWLICLALKELVVSIWTTKEWLNAISSLCVAQSCLHLLDCFIHYHSCDSICAIQRDILIRMNMPIDRSTDRLIDWSTEAVAILSNPENSNLE